jgi:hypothetical protein
MTTRLVITQEFESENVMDIVDFIDDVRLWVERGYKSGVGWYIETAFSNNPPSIHRDEENKGE